MKTKAIIAIIVLLLFGIGTGLIIFNRLSVVKNTQPAPWPVEISQLKSRLAAMNLPTLTTEGTTLHIHQHLDIYINGQKIPVPAGIGINEQEGFIAPIHTHDNTGIIHVESPTIQNFTLGQFFNIWDVRFNQNCIGDYCNSDNSSLRIFSNGQEVKSNFTNLVLEPHQEIVLVYGTNQNLPKPIPSQYSFPENY